MAEDGSDLLGDGVNVAVRLEGFAEPGGIVASAAVLAGAGHTGVVPAGAGAVPAGAGAVPAGAGAVPAGAGAVPAGAGAVSAEDLGEQALRNIPRPVRVFRLRVEEPGTTPARRPPPASASKPGDASGFADRPAIAVLPFRYRGADAHRQEHLADGVTEEVIHALARWRTFPVVARGSVFVFKGRDLDPREAGRALGARYILEGTLRRRGIAGLRLDALLADAESGQTLLSETFEAEEGASGAGALEDEIARGIVATLEPALLRHETERAAFSGGGRDAPGLGAGPGTATAYNLFLRGLWHHHRYTDEDNARARAFLGQALDLAPGYAKATATLALAECQATYYRGPEQAAARDALFAAALRHAEAAARLDPQDPICHFAEGTALSMNGRPLAESAAAYQRAIRLDPSHAAAHGSLGIALNGMDRPAEGLARIEFGLKLTPHDPRRFLWVAPKAVSHYLLGDFAAAVGTAREALALKRNHPVALRPLVASLGMLGLAADAAPFLAVLARVDGGPAGTEAALRRYYGPGPLARLTEGLRRAGYGVVVA